MIKVGLSGNAAAMVAMAGVCALLVGCGGDTGTAQTAASNSSMPIDRSQTETAQGMQIQGTPATVAAVGQAYSFQPTVPGATSTSVRFSITNLPAWAKFDAATGKLTGTPSATQVGTYKGITIAATSGANKAALPAFSIVVGAGNPQSNVTLSWAAPTQNADGSTLVDLKGYKVHYGSESRNYQDTIELANAGLTTYVVQNLAAGKYYFAVTSYNGAGQESSLSPEVSTQVD